MRAIEHELDRINAAFDGSANFGTPLRRGLDGLSELSARRRAIDDVHSILEIVVHTTTWIEVAARRLRGEMIDPSTVHDWPDLTGRSWQPTLESLERAQSQLADSIARLTPEALDRKLAGSDATARTLIDFVINHNVFHAGQIAMLKKIV